MPNVVDKSPSSGYLFVLVLFAFVFVLMLPLVGMMLVDTMVVKREAKAQMEKTEKLRKQIEEERKKDDGKTGSQIGPH
jgi:preprotein translocase subunit YajC